MKNILLSSFISCIALLANAQCTWTTISYDSYEYTTVIPDLIPGTTYQSTPQTYTGCVRTGSYGMYMNFVNGFVGVAYSRTYTNLCVGQSYRFSFSTRDAFSSTNNMTFTVYDNNNVVLSTQNVITNSTWQDIVMPAFTATTSSIRFEIATNTAGGAGNDAGFDDLRLNQCQPTATYTLNQCNPGSSFNLFPLIVSPVLSNTGVWTGPSMLTNGSQGTFTPGSNINGVYTYTVDGLGTCPDSIAQITVNLTNTPDINPIAAINACQTTTLPAITGTNLSNPQYYTGVNGTGTAYPPGTSITSSQTLYAYSGLAGCSDQETVSISISQAYQAGNDDDMMTCSPIGNLDLFSTLSGVFDINGTWTETTPVPSGQLNGSVLSTNNMSGGNYTFTYTVPANGACASDVSTFSFYLGGDLGLELGNDTTFCPGQNVVLNPGVYDSYLWDNSSTSPTRTVSAPGDYHVRVGTMGSNAIINGDFSSGNTGFTTNYVVGTGGTWGQLSNPGTYAINTSPNNVHLNFSSCSDHTPDPEANMMIVNGAGTANTNVWCQTIPVQTNTDYQFSTWVMSALNDANVAQLQFKINGGVLGSIFSPSPTGCIWNQFYQTWNSGVSTSAQICIVNQNTTGGGNDFALDDIEFSPICYAYDTITISNYPTPVITATPNVTICQGEVATITASSVTSGINYTWNPGNIQNAVLNVSPNNSTVYTVIGTSAQGCISNAVNRTVIVNPTPLAEIELNGNDTICTGSTTLLNALTSLESTFEWSPGGSTDDVIVVSPTSDQEYTLSVTGSNGCTKDTSIVIYVIPELDVTISGQTSICESETTTLTAIGNNPQMTFSWQPMNQNGSQITVGSSNVGWVYVYGDYFLCPQAKDSVEITLNADPVVTAPDSVEVCPGQTVDVSASVDQPGSTVFWFPAGVSGLNQSFTTTETTTILLVAQNGNCISDTVSFTISVDGACYLDIPNVFTPNGDLDNDFFHLISYDGIISLECTILNRWGNVIREFNVPDFQWDGTDENGNKVIDGTYFYTIKAVSSASEEFEKTGFIQLIR